MAAGRHDESPRRAVLLLASREMHQIPSVSTLYDYNTMITYMLNMCLLEFVYVGRLKLAQEKSKM